MIHGHPADLSVWQHRLKHQSDVWVEMHDSETVLRATSLQESESATDARDRAIAYIDRLNGAMALSHADSRPVQLREVIRFMPDGHSHRTLFVEPAKFEGRGSVIAGATVIGADGPPPAPESSEVQRWSGVADEEELLDDALIYFGKIPQSPAGEATDWFDIYKALECLIDRFDRGDVSKFLERDWAPAAEVKRLRETANSFRHARRRPHRKPPENPIGFKEARELLGQLLRRALEAAK